MRAFCLPQGVVAHWRDTCCVAPSPELRAQWAQAIEQISKDGSHPPMTVGPNPKRLGFDDGVILPPEDFPPGVSPAAMSAAAADRAPLRGTVRVIVILVDFSDKHMAATANHYNELFFSTGALSTGSVKEYYSEVSNGLVTLSGAVVGPYRMPHTLAWYANGNSGIALGGGEFRSPQLALDAANAANADVNFAPYDNDGNGYVDAFVVVHAGQGAEQTGSSGDIWSHKATLATPFSTDGTKIYAYLTVPEDARLGVCAHELGHLLFGFPDLYDTDNTSEGIGNWCLMASGSWNAGGNTPAHPSAWCKINQGWATVTNVTSDGSVSIPDVKSSHNVLRLWKDGGGGPEYFLVENRQKTGFDAALPGSGLLVWHIDENQANNNTDTHYKVALLESDAQLDLEHNTNRGDAGDPYPGSKSNVSLTGTTMPSTKSYAGQQTCVSVTSISASGPTMTAQIRVHCSKSTTKDAKDAKDGIKDQKELAKDAKELRKETKEFWKEAFKEGKELRKELKDLKEREKFVKEIENKLRDTGLEGWDLFGGGFAPPAAADPSALEARIATLEALVYAQAGAPNEVPSQPFISAELRPDLVGAAPQRGPQDVDTRLASGDRDAKRELDCPPATRRR